MKHPAKVILKSEIFKISRTPQKTPDTYRKNESRSPPPKSPRAIAPKSQLKVDANELFQKVCCPNCKYVFKIIKDSDILKREPLVRKTVDIPVNKMTQTEDSVLKQTLQLKLLSESLSKQISNRNQSSLFQAQSFRNNSFTVNQALQSDRIRGTTYKFEQLPFFKAQVPKKNSVPSQPQSSVPSLQQDNLQKTMKSEKQKPIEMQKEARDKQLAKKLQKKQEQLKTLLIHKIESDSLLGELCEFYRQLPQSLQIPAYRKMLVRQYTVSPITYQTY